MRYTSAQGFITLSHKIMINLRQIKKLCRLQVNLDPLLNMWNAAPLE